MYNINQPAHNLLLFRQQILLFYNHAKYLKGKVIAIKNDVVEMNIGKQCKHHLQTTTKQL